MSTDPQQDWKHWHEQRVETVSGPYGPLSLTGTHWLSDYPEGRIPAVPGKWTADGDEVVLTAAPEDGITVDGQPLTGEARLTADTGTIPESRVAADGRRLVVLRREGLWAVRVFDPGSPARRAFAGLEVTPYDAKWALPGRFRPYEEGRTTIQVENADGRERGRASPGRSPSGSTASSTRFRSRSRTTARSGRSSPTRPAETVRTASASCGRPRPRPTPR